MEEGRAGAELDTGELDKLEGQVLEVVLSGGD